MPTTGTSSATAISQKEFGGGNAPYQYDDAALHLFYNLDHATLKKAVYTLANARNRVHPLAQIEARLETMNVSPAMSIDGLQGSYAQAVFAQIVEIANTIPLARIAFSRTIERGKHWSFSSSKRMPDNSFAGIPIPGTQGEATIELRFDKDGHKFKGEISPTVNGRDTANAFITHDFNSAEDSVRDGLNHVIRLEHASIHGPGTADCMSCHSATNIRETYIPQVTDQGSLFPSWPESPWNLKRNVPVVCEHNNLHAFSYLFDVPSIIQRTINESSMVVNAIEHL